MLNRRDFLKGGLAAAAIGAAARGRAADEGAPVRFLVAADIHYRPGVFPFDTDEQLRKIVARGVSEKVDFGIQLGDFQHDAKRGRAFIDLWNDAPFRTFNVIGNHDDDATTPAETRAALRLERGWYRFDVRGVRFVVLDTNYGFVNGAFVHYGRGCGFSPYKLGAADRLRLHPDEFPFLEEALGTATGPCVILSHRMLAGEDADAVRVRQIVAAANRARPGRVALALCGHNHCDRMVRRDGVSYLTVNSPNHVWIPFRHKGYPDEDVRRWREIDHVVAYDGTPLSAVVTVCADGHFAVRGLAGGFWRGIAPEQLSKKLTKRGIAPVIRDYEG